MAVTHPTAVRIAVTDFIVDQLDEGTPPGNIVYRSSGNAEVAMGQFSNPAFGAANGSALATANAIADDTGATGGTIAKATLENAAGVAKINCSVTAIGGGGDIEISDTAVAPGQTVQTTSITYASMP